MARSKQEFDWCGKGSLKGGREKTLHQKQQQQKKTKKKNGSPEIKT